MKKLIALVLAIILLAGIIGFALADCTHNNKHCVGSYTVTTIQYIAMQHGCLAKPWAHTHWRYKYDLYRRYLCYTCGDVSVSYDSTTYGKVHCN